MSEERVTIKQLYHGSHDLNLKQLVPRPLTNLDTFGTWLADIKSASSYGSIIYKVATDKSVLLDEYYDLFDMFAAFNMSKSMSIPDMKRIRSKLENMGYDGFKLTMLDGMTGYFACIFNDYPIKVIKVKEMAMGFLSKVELKKQLIGMGIKITEGNYIQKKDIQRLKRILSGSDFTKELSNLFDTCIIHLQEFKKLMEANHQILPQDYVYGQFFQYLTKLEKDISSWEQTYLGEVEEEVKNEKKLDQNRPS